MEKHFHVIETSGLNNSDWKLGLLPVLNLQLHFMSNLFLVAPKVFRVSGNIIWILMVDYLN